MTLRRYTDMTHSWLSVSEAARYFGKHHSVVRRWCYDGDCIDFGFRLRRDITGHWWIGIPSEQLRDMCDMSSTI